MATILLEFMCYHSYQIMLLFNGLAYISTFLSNSYTLYLFIFHIWELMFFLYKYFYLWPTCMHRCFKVKSGKIAVLLKIFLNKGISDSCINLSPIFTIFSILVNGDKIHVTSFGLPWWQLWWEFMCYHSYQIILLFNGLAPFKYRVFTTVWYIIGNRIRVWNCDMLYIKIIMSILIISYQICGYKTTWYYLRITGFS